MEFFMKMPRNKREFVLYFGFALATELLIAQPIARGLLFLIHKRIDRRAEALKAGEIAPCAENEK